MFHLSYDASFGQLALPSSRFIQLYMPVRADIHQKHAHLPFWGRDAIFGGSVGVTDAGGASCVGHANLDLVWCRTELP